MPDTTLKLTAVLEIKLKVTPMPSHDIEANPCVRNNTEGNPHARHGIEAYRCVRDETEGNP